MTNSLATRIEKLYVVDTHALIWYVMKYKKLSSTARAIFEAAERKETLLILSSIVLAELYFANAKNGWFKDYQQVYQLITSQKFFRVIPFRPEDTLDFEQDATVPEMHDRIIAGLARRLSAPLITSDPLITASGVATIVW